MNNVKLSFNNGLSVNGTPYVCSGNVDSCEILHAEISHCINADFNLKPDDEDVASSINDNKCQMIYDTSVEKVDGRYTIDLLLKDNDVEAPDNRTQAEFRLMQQRKFLKRDEFLKQFSIESI